MAAGWPSLIQVRASAAPEQLYRLDLKLTRTQP